MSISFPYRLAQTDGPYTEKFTQAKTKEAENEKEKEKISSYSAHELDLYANFIATTIQSVTTNQMRFELD